MLTTDHGEPEIAATPDPVTFGIVPVSGSQTRTVWIDNYGASPLRLGALGLTGTNASQFDLTADECSDRRLFSSQSCTLTVAFNPTSTGAKTGLLQIPSDDPDEALIALTLVGGTEGTPTVALTIAKEGVGDGTITVFPADRLRGRLCGQLRAWRASLAHRYPRSRRSVWRLDRRCRLLRRRPHHERTQYCVGRFGEARFDDVPFAYWAWQSIELIAIARITTGCAPGAIAQRIQ